jgi:MerR family transcriptional regulator, thiopeptide resistance regulator
VPDWPVSVKGDAVSWSIVEVARISGVTARTLRHYDEVGLLRPAGVRDNGYRFYEEDGLLRLQQILVLRALDLGLTQIAAILDQQTDQLQALRHHHRRLLAERDRLDQVAATIAHTITELETTQGAPGMSKISRPENLFEGFNATDHDAEARERWPQQWEQAHPATAGLTPEELTLMQREQTAAMIRMAELMIAGVPVTDPAVQSEVDSTYRGVGRFWTPNAQAFKGLGQMYVDDPRFTATYDAITPGLAAYYSDAMATYADNQLT